MKKLFAYLFILIAGAMLIHSPAFASELSFTDWTTQTSCVIDSTGHTCDDPYNTTIPTGTWLLTSNDGYYNSRTHVVPTNLPDNITDVEVCFVLTEFDSQQFPTIFAGTTSQASDIFTTTQTVAGMNCISFDEAYLSGDIYINVGGNDYEGDHLVQATMPINGFSFNVTYTSPTPTPAPEASTISCDFEVISTHYGATGQYDGRATRVYFHSSTGAVTTVYYSTSGTWVFDPEYYNPLLSTYHPNVFGNNVNHACGMFRNSYNAMYNWMPDTYVNPQFLANNTDIYCYGTNYNVPQSDNMQSKDPWLMMMGTGTGTIAVTACDINGCNACTVKEGGTDEIGETSTQSCDALDVVCWLGYYVRAVKSWFTSLFIPTTSLTRLGTLQNMVNAKSPWAYLNALRDMNMDNPDIATSTAIPDFHINAIQMKIHDGMTYDIFPETTVSGSIFDDMMPAVEAIRTGVGVFIIASWALAMALLIMEGVK